MARNRLRAFAVGTGLSLLVLPGLTGLLKPLVLRLAAPPAALAGMIVTGLPPAAWAEPSQVPASPKRKPAD